MAEQKSIYQVIQDIVQELRNGGLNYNSMIRRLVEAGMDVDSADKLLDRLMKQVDDEQE